MVFTLLLFMTQVDEITCFQDYIFTQVCILILYMIFIFLVKNNIQIKHTYTIKKKILRILANELQGSALAL